MHEKFQYYKGLKFTRDEKTGYYLNSTHRIRMHKWVWLCEKGEIPEGYDVHHKDGDKGNNDISNLELLTKAEHHRKHYEQLSSEEKQRYVNNMNTVARPAANEWHKSEDGRKWHSEMVKKAWKDGRLGVTSEFICEQCGKKFERIYKPGLKFCSGACAQKYRREHHLSDIIIKCPVCGKNFYTEKYRPAKTCSRKCTIALKKKGN